MVAVNIDTRDPDKPRAWLQEVGVDRLAYYADPSAKVFQDLKIVGRAIGMPTTLLVDPAGCEIGTMAGPAEWASANAVTLAHGGIREIRGGCCHSDPARLRQAQLQSAHQGIVGFGQLRINRCKCLWR